MNEELQAIVQRMLDAGEPEENIKLVIEQYNANNVEKTTDVAEPGAAVASETPAPVSGVSPSVDTSLESPVPSITICDSPKLNFILAPIGLVLPAISDTFVIIFSKLIGNILLNLNEIFLIELLIILIVLLQMNLEYRYFMMSIKAIRVFFCNLVVMR